LSQEPVSGSEPVALVQLRDLAGVLLAQRSASVGEKPKHGKLLVVEGRPQPAPAELADAVVAGGGAMLLSNAECCRTASSCPRRHRAASSP
jgi:hypothetical protein